MNKLKSIPAAIFALILLSVSALGCTCVYSGIKANGSFQGQVFGITQNEKMPDPKNIVPKATVKLWLPTDEENTIIAQTVADENGRFVLENVKPGNYIFQVSGQMYGLQDIVVGMKILSGSNLMEKEIIIGLAPGLTCCEGYIKVRKAKKRLKNEPCRLGQPA